MIGRIILFKIRNRKCQSLLIIQQYALSFVGHATLTAGALITMRLNMSRISINVKPISIAVSDFITRNFNGIKVVGNEIPSHLIPLNGCDTKYYDNRSKKYVNFPAIGAFEVVFGGKLLFSKKKTNGWPDFGVIKGQIK